MELIINQPSVQKMENNKSRLVTVIERGSEKYPLYFEVESKFEKYLTYEVLDPFVVNLLLYSMQHGLDIVCKGKVTERLYWQLTEYMIPAISTNVSKYKKIEIKCDGLSNEKFGGKYAATGLSCGVDSFYTILKNQQHSEESGMNVKSLTFFNVGAFGNGGEKPRKLFYDRAKNFKEVAKDLGCEFVTVDSNLCEFLHQNFKATHVFRTLSVPLALQKLFNVYYFSSGFEYADFRFDKATPAYYDILTMPNLSTDNIRYVLVGGETTRQGKVNFISNFDIVKKHLNVCCLKVDNCGICMKCRKTLLNMLIAGKFEEYAEVLGVKPSKKKVRGLIRWAIAHRKKIDINEIYALLKEKHMIKPSDYFWAFFIPKFYINI